MDRIDAHKTDESMIKEDKYIPLRSKSKLVSISYYSVKGMSKTKSN